MANREIDKLRREAASRAQAASRKIQRLRSQGIVVAGSEFDPRRDSSKVANYNTRQAKAYIAKLNAFTNRNTRFVGSAEGQPIPMAEARKFEATKQQFNAYVQNYRNAFKDISVEPLGGASIEDLNKRASGDWKTFAKGRSAQRPLAESESDIADINGLDKLRKLEKNMRQRMKGDYLKERVAQGREQAGQMLDRVGADSDLRKSIDALSDFQFNVLWHEMDFADSLSQSYWLVKNANVREAATMQEESLDDVRALIEWAGKPGNLEPRP